MKSSLLSILFISSAFFALSQPLQTVRGNIYESETNFPLTGVRVQIFTGDSTIRLITASKGDGSFTIKNVPIGKHQLTAKLSMFDEAGQVIEVSSGKELIVDIPMTEMIQEQEEITIAARRKGAVLNEMAVLSAQQFSVEETNRYPGSRMDPARMASNFAGVQGSDDSRNDIVIRGNSPLSVVWRVEGIDIPNPSHFAISGSTGGPVSILNNKILSNSDFFMSAFPAEYGNSTSGVFDLRLRNGNNNRHEFTGQFGFLGTEFLAEGPMSKSGKSSYLVMGRYSTLSIFQAIGIKIGTDAIPLYGDGAFKFNWKLKNGGMFSWFGIGGKSKIDILISDQTELTDELYGESDRDQLFGTSMGVSGINFKKPLNEKTYVSATIGVSFEEQHTDHIYLHRSLDTNATTQQINISVDSSFNLMAYDFMKTKLIGHLGIKHKLNKKNILKLGFNAEGMYMSQNDSIRSSFNSSSAFTKRWDYSGLSILVQPFVQYKLRINDQMDFTAGIHSQYFSLSNSISVAEPRLGWKYRFGNGQSVFAGAGMHSQTQPNYTYTYHLLDNNGNKIYHNKNMDFIRSIHTGAGYEKFFLKQGISVRTEAYYQHLYNIPVTISPSSFSLINMGSGFSRIFPDSLENTGTGTNYGVELTVQKFFDKSYFFMFSGTLYESKYVGSDGIERNTSFNGNYVANLLLGKEFKLGKKQIIGLGVKSTVAGGKRYGYPDVAQTQALNEIIFLDSAFNERQFKYYFRLDLKISWRMNANKMTHEIGLDLVNVTNNRNLLSLVYAPKLDPNDSSDPIAEKQQLGFLPIFYYKVDFRPKVKNNTQAYIY